MKKQTYDLEERLLEYTEIAVECSVLGVCFFIRCSSFKTTPYGINATCKRLLYVFVIFLNMPWE